MKSLREKVVVTTDGSPLADKILERVQPLVRPGETRVRILRVVESEAVDEAAAAKAVFQEARAHLETLARRVAGWGAKVETALMVGDPAAKILEYVEAQRPSLVALSTHGRTGVQRWIRGSVAERVLRECRFPLLLANPFELGKVRRPGRFERILVPVDGSEASAAILPLALELALGHDAEVVLFHAFQPGLDESSLETRADAGALLGRYKEQLDGIPARTLVATGRPAEAILRAVAKEHCDLVAMTTHGRSGVSRWMLGSVAENVLRNGRCPVLLHRTGLMTEQRLPAKKKGGKEATSSRA